MLDGVGILEIGGGDGGLRTVEHRRWFGWCLLALPTLTSPTFANGGIIGHVGIEPFAFGLFIAIAVQEARSLPNRMAAPIVDHGSTIHERQIDHLYLAVSQDVIAIDFRGLHRRAP